MSFHEGISFDDEVAMNEAGIGIDDRSSDLRCAECGVALPDEDSAYCRACEHELGEQP